MWEKCDSFGITMKMPLHPLSNPIKLKPQLNGSLVTYAHFFHRFLFYIEYMLIKKGEGNIAFLSFASINISGSVRNETFDHYRPYHSNDIRWMKTAFHMERVSVRVTRSDSTVVVVVFFRNANESYRASDYTHFRPNRRYLTNSTHIDDDMLSI